MKVSSDKIGSALRAVLKAGCAVALAAVLASSGLLSALPDAQAATTLRDNSVVSTAAKRAKARNLRAKRAKALKAKRAKQRRRAKVLRKRRAKLAILRHMPKGWRSAKASWYGPGFYGQGLPGGGKLTRKSMIVAHKKLPFGTKLQIKYHGRTVVATVRDRGPFIRGRDFDLGPGTARKLRFSGVGKIRYKIMGL